jgi:hypothetical protein
MDLASARDGSLHQRQARVGNAILQLQKHKAVGLREAVKVFYGYSKDKQDELIKSTEAPLSLTLDVAEDIKLRTYSTGSNSGYLVHETLSNPNKITKLIAGRRATPLFCGITPEQ